MNYMSCRFDKDTSMVSRCFHSLTEFPIGGQTDRFTLKCNPTLGSWRRSGYMFFFSSNVICPKCILLASIFHVDNRYATSASTTLITRKIQISIG